MDSAVFYKPPSQTGSSQTKFIPPCSAYASSLHKRSPGPRPSIEWRQDHVEWVPSSEPGVWILSPVPNSGLADGLRPPISVLHPGPDRLTRIGGLLEDGENSDYDDEFPSLKQNPPSSSPNPMPTQTSAQSPA